MKTILVSDDVHRRFKALCAMRGVPIQSAADQALEAVMMFLDEGSITPEEAAQELERIGAPVTFVREEDCQ